MGVQRKAEGEGMIEMDATSISHAAMKQELKYHGYMSRMMKPSSLVCIAAALRVAYWPLASRAFFFHEDI